ncbi:MAG: DUF4350 domain-containing protein [Streptosporangiaceae bacterium]
MTATVTGHPAGSGPAAGGRVTGGPTAQAWRRWRVPLAIVAVIIAGGIVVALLQPPAGTTGYLDPGNPQPDGARALATLLAERGSPVARVSTVSAAAAAATPKPASGPSAGRREPVTLLITDPGLLTVGQLKSLAAVPGDRFIVEPDPAVLAVLAPGVTDVRQVPVQPLPPQCGLPAARLAGSADLGGAALHTTVPGAGRCYPVNGHPSLVRYSAGDRVITVLGTSAPLTNSSLAQLGNAALSLNLLGGSSRIVWLVPSPPAPGAAPNGQQAFTSIVPLGAYLVAIQLVIAAILAALWRGRRLGPVVAERLPVVVRAAETVEGHGHLYWSRRSRDRAATALREAARGRILRLLGLPGTAGAAEVAAALAPHSGRSAGEIVALLAGPVPADDAALVALADDLDVLERDALEREVPNP